MNTITKYSEYEVQRLTHFLSSYGLKEKFVKNLHQHGYISATAKEPLKAHLEFLEGLESQRECITILEAFPWCSTDEGSDFWKAVNDIWYEEVIGGFSAKEAQNSSTYNKALLRFTEFKTLMKSINAWEPFTSNLICGDFSYINISVGYGIDSLKGLIIILLMSEDLTYQDVFKLLAYRDSHDIAMICEATDKLLAEHEGIEWESSDEN